MNYLNLWRDLAGKTLLGFRDDGAIEVRSLIFPDGTVQTSAYGEATLSFSDITGRPTTLAGYGITDAGSSMITGGTGVTSKWVSAITGAGACTLSQPTFTDLSAHPTTLSGYGRSEEH